MKTTHQGFIAPLLLALLLLGAGAYVYMQNKNGSPATKDALVLGETIVFQGDWGVQKISDRDGLFLTSFDLLAEDICSKYIRDPHPPCESTQELIGRLVKEDSSFKILRQPFLKVERTDTEWNEGSGTTFTVYLTDSEGGTYYIGEDYLMRGEREGLIVR